jgi:hypothetical protein
MVLVVCRERDELEKQINAQLRLMSENSTKAAKLAHHPEPETEAQFRSLHNEDALLKERIETLKYCLQLHKDWHGC